MNKPIAIKVNQVSFDLQERIGFLELILFVENIQITTEVIISENDYKEIENCKEMIYAALMETND